MYEKTNPAVIKSILARMSKDELTRHVEYIRKQAHELPLGNRRSMFVRLYGFAVSLL